MFCQKCGNQMQDNEKFCTACGAPVENDAETPQNQPAGSAPAPQTPPTANKIVDFVKAHIIPLAGGLIALIAIIAIVAGIVTGQSAEGIAKKYVKAVGGGELKKADGYMLISTEDAFEKAAKAADKELDEYLEDTYNCDSMKEYWNDNEEDMEDMLEDNYGKSVKVSIKKVKKVDKYSNKKLKEFRNEHEKYFDAFEMDSEKVKAVADVTIKTEIKGKDDDDTTEMTITLVKYKGKWKVFNESWSYLSNVVDKD